MFSDSENEQNYISKDTINSLLFLFFGQTVLIVWFSYNSLEIYRNIVEYKVPGILKNIHIKLKSLVVELLKKIIKK